MIKFSKLVGDSRRKMPPRRRVEDVLQIVGGASPRGSSYWKRVRRCPREHGLYSIGLRKGAERSEALDLGLLFHHALEVYFKTVQLYQSKLTKRDEEFYWGSAAAAEKAAWDSIAPFADEEGYSSTYARVEKMLIQYFENYRRRDRWRIIAVEETLIYDEADLTYTARLDLIVECADRGGMWIVEHKTAQSITEDLLHNYALDLQIVGQVWLMQQVIDLDEYPPLRGVLVDIMTKPKSTKHGSITVPKFERFEVCPSREHVEEFYNSMVQWTAVSQTFEQLGWPKALGNCAGGMRFFRKCPYFDLCDTRPKASVADFAAELKNDALIGFREDHAEVPEDWE